jgi:hypothetical protein
MKTAELGARVQMRDPISKTTRPMRKMGFTEKRV